MGSGSVCWSPPGSGAGLGTSLGSAISLFLSTVSTRCLRRSLPLECCIAQRCVLGPGLRVGRAREDMTFAEVPGGGFRVTGQRPGGLSGRAERDVLTGGRNMNWHTEDGRGEFLNRRVPGRAADEQDPVRTCVEGVD